MCSALQSALKVDVVIGTSDGLSRKINFNFISRRLHDDIKFWLYSLQNDAPWLCYIKTKASLVVYSCNQRHHSLFNLVYFLIYM